MAFFYYFIYLLSLYLIGSWILVRAIDTTYKEKINKLPVTKLSIALSLGISTHILIAHLLAILIMNYSFTTYLSLFSLLAIVLIDINFTKKITWNDLGFENLSLIDTLAITISSSIGILMYFRDQFFSSADRVHMGYIGVLSNNSIYPPLAPSGKDFSLSYFHYGTDLIGASIKTITGADIFQSMSFEIALGSFLTFVAIYSFIVFFTASKIISLLISLATVFYTSINSIQYLFIELNKLPSEHFFQQWLISSWTSVSHLTSQLRLPSQNISFGFAIILLLFIINQELVITKKQKGISYYLPFLILSFIVYCCYPTFWYPTLAAFGLFSGLQLCSIYLNKTSRTQFPQLIGVLFFTCTALVLGKILCFNTGLTKINNVETMIFSPHLSWLHWGKSYLYYFYDLDYLRTLSAVMDPTNGSSFIKIPLFSSISFREFGLSSIIALTIMIQKFIKHKQNDRLSILFYAGLISFLVPFLFEFTLRPIETARFLMWAKILFTIFNFTHLAKLIHSDSYKKLAAHKIATFLIAIILIPASIPGLLGIIPNEKIIVLGSKGLTAKERVMYKYLESIHKEGEVVLSTKMLEQGSDYVGLAGFYGVGGQLYIDDLITRSTAMASLNPALLRELEVDYVITSPDEQISSVGQARLKDSNLFQEITKVNEINSDYHLYKFIKREYSQEELNALQKEYTWALVYPNGNQFNILQDSKQNLLVSNDKANLNLIKTQAIESLKSAGGANNMRVAVWLKAQAVPKDHQQY